MVVKKNPKEKGNRNNGQTKIKRIVDKIFTPTRYKMLPYPSALMRVPAWGVIATSAVVMVLTMHRIKYSFSL